ncbi:MAG: LPS export ABC transporter periplasmic protein LptC, partial [Hyphomicrobium sp.]
MATTTNLAPGQSWTGLNPGVGATAADRARNFARARRHTGVVRTLRLLLPATAVGVVVIYFGMILNGAGWVEGMPGLVIPRIMPDNLTMDNPRYEGFNKDGGAYVITAKTAMQDLVNTEHIQLNDINGDLTDAKKSKTNLKAAQGDFNTKTNELELSGGIDIVAESGLRAKLSRATIQTKENIIFSKEPVLVELPAGKIRSNEMRMLNKSREIAFVGDVEAHLTPRQDDKQTEAAKPASPLIGSGKGPIDIKANRLDIDDTGKTATFTGNVKAQQAEASLETAELEVVYEGGDAGNAGVPGAGAKIQRITSKSPVVMTRAPKDRVTGDSLDYDAIGQVAVVNGDVKMQSGADRRASADKATVDQLADTIMLSGNVVAVQGRNQLKGERLYAEQKTGRTQLSSPAVGGGEPGRISTRFFRGDPSGGAQSAKQKIKHAVADAAGAPLGVFQTDPTAPIDIDALRLDVDDRSKQAVFKGDVHAVQGDFIVRTSSLRAFYTGSAGLAEQADPSAPKPAADITRIEARGKVIVTSKNGQNANGEWADFDVKNNQVVLGGDVVLTQGKNVVRGTKLTINMVTGEAV